MIPSASRTPWRSSSSCSGAMELECTPPACPFSCRVRRTECPARLEMNQLPSGLAMNLEPIRSMSSARSRPRRAHWTTRLRSQMPPADLTQSSRNSASLSASSSSGTLKPTRAWGLEPLSPTRPLSTKSTSAPARAASIAARVAAEPPPITSTSAFRVSTACSFFARSRGPPGRSLVKISYQ